MILLAFVWSLRKIKTQVEFHLSISTYNVNSNATVHFIVTTEKSYWIYVYFCRAEISPFWWIIFFFGIQLAKTSTNHRMLEIRNFPFPQVTKVCSSFWIEAILVWQTCSKEQLWSRTLLTVLFRWLSHAFIVKVESF